MFHSLPLVALQYQYVLNPLICPIPTFAMKCLFICIFTHFSRSILHTRKQIARWAQLNRIELCNFSGCKTLTTYVARVFSTWEEEKQNVNRLISIRKQIACNNRSACKKRKEKLLSPPAAPCTRKNARTCAPAIVTLKRAQFRGSPSNFRNKSVAAQRRYQ